MRPTAADFSLFGECLSVLHSLAFFRNTVVDALYSSYLKETTCKEGVYKMTTYFADGTEQKTLFPFGGTSRFLDNSTGKFILAEY